MFRKKPEFRKKTVEIKKPLISGFFYCSGGGRGEIRTHGGLAPTTVFKTVALNRSATLPYNRINNWRFFKKQDYSKDLVVLNILIREKNVGVAEIF